MKYALSVTLLQLVNLTLSKMPSKDRNSHLTLKEIKVKTLVSNTNDACHN